MNLTEKLLKLNSLVDMLELPEVHLLSQYRKKSEKYITDERITSGMFFFINNYISLVQDYFFNSQNYHLLMLIINNRDEVSINIRTNIMDNRRTHKDLSDLLDKVKALIAKLKFNNINTNIYEQELENFINSYSNQNNEFYFGVAFLNFMHDEISPLAHTLVDPVASNISHSSEVEVHQSFFMILIYRCFNFFVLNSQVSPQVEEEVFSPNITENNEHNLDTRVTCLKGNIDDVSDF